MRMNTKRLAKVAGNTATLTRIAERIRQAIKIDAEHFRIEVKVLEHLVTIAGKRVNYEKVAEDVRMLLVDEGKVRSVHVQKCHDSWRPHFLVITLADDVLSMRPIRVSLPKASQTLMAARELANAQRWLTEKQRVLAGDEPESVARATIALIEACREFEKFEDTEAGSAAYNLLDADPFDCATPEEVFNAE